MSKSRKKLSKKTESDLTQQEREKIIEVLLSQERVLTLLYDKTFPPNLAESNQVKATIKQAQEKDQEKFDIEMPEL